MIRTCLFCLTEFDSTGRTKLCSDECRIYRRRDQDIGRKKKNDYRPVDYDRRSCDVCGVVYKPKACNQKLCGAKECRAEYTRRLMKTAVQKAKNRFRMRAWYKTAAGKAYSKEYNVNYRAKNGNGVKRAVETKKCRMRRAAAESALKIAALAASLERKAES